MSQFESLKELFNKTGTSLQLMEPTSLYEEGNPVKFVYKLVSGRVLLFSKEKSKSLPRFARSGQILGLNAIHRGVYHESSQCLDTIHLKRLDIDNIQEFLNQKPPIKIMIIQELCREVNHIERRNLQFFNKSPKQKIALVICDFFKTYVPDREEAIDFSQPLPQFAQFLGVSTTYLEKALNELNENGWIQKSGNLIRILNPSAIENFASYAV